MSDLQIKAMEWFQAHEQEMLDTLYQLVEIRSVSDASAGKPGAPYGEGCRKVLDKAMEISREMGFDVKDCEGHCAAVSTGDDEHAFGIAAHLDVVPEGDKWIHTPYKPTREGDFLFGRGVSDNKNAAVLGLYCMKFLNENWHMKHGIRVIMGTSEETGMADLAYYSSHYECPELTMVADGAFPVNYAQKGSLRGYFTIPAGEMLTEFTGGEVFNMVPPHARATLKGYDGELPQAEDISVEKTEDAVIIRAKGVAAHAAAPDGGKSAIHTLAGYLKALPLDNASLKAAESIWEVSRDTTGANMGVDGEDPDTGKTTMVIGTAEMENGLIKLQVDSRLSIACDPEQCALKFAEKANELGFTICEPMETTPPVWLSKEDPRVQTLQKIYKDLTGDDRPPYTMGGGTYSRVLPRVVTFGPGFPGDTARPEGLPAGHGGAHAPDEYLYIPSWLKACALYACALAELDATV